MKRPAILPRPSRAHSPWAASVLIALLLAACTQAPPPSVESVTVRAPAHVVLGGEARALADLTSRGRVDIDVTWSSSDQTVLLVDGSGTITAVGYGSASVTATSVFDPSVSGSADVEVIDDPWAALPNLPYAVARTAGVFVDGVFYVIGGESAGGQRLGRVQAYDPVADTWDGNLPIMPQPVSNLCAVVLDGDVYVPGGNLALNQASTALRRFDVGSRSWSLLDDDPLPAQRIGHACAVHDGRIYLFGGYDPINNAVYREPWVYDPSAAAGQRWITGLDRPVHDGAYGSAVSVGEYLYYAGFVSPSPIAESTNVMRYHPASDTWDRMPSSRAAHGGGELWTDGEQLFLVGGGWNVYLSSVEAYDLAEGLEGAWAITLPMASGRRTFALAYDPDGGTVYLAGGWDGDHMRGAEAGFGAHLRQ